MFDPSTYQDKTTNPTAHVLRDAADYIRENGWRQNGQGCLVFTFNQINALLCGAASDSLMTFITGSPRTMAALDVITWNDAPGRTKEDVIQALEGAAAAVEASA